MEPFIEQTLAEIDAKRTELDQLAASIRKLFAEDAPKPSPLTPPVTLDLKPKRSRRGQ